MLDSDDPVVADLLAGLLEVLASSGGWLNPGARLAARNGQLSVHADAQAGEPLLHVPRAALIRVERVEWAVSKGALIPAAFSDELGDLELEALFLLTGLLNQCGKLPELIRTHPLLAPDLSTELVTAMRAFRGSFGFAQPDPVSLLWSSRCFRVGFDEGSPEPVAVPILELMNHHTRGASAEWANGGFAVPAQIVDADECFLDYGRDRDAISMAVVYGFADLSARVAHSAPMDVDVPGVGRVVVAARGRDRTGELLPVSVSTDPDGIVINRLTFGDGHSPTHELARATGWSQERANAVVEAVRHVNIELLEGVQRAARASAPSPAAATLATAAEVQQRIIVGHAEETARVDRWRPRADAQVDAISDDDFDLGQWGVR